MSRFFLFFFKAGTIAVNISRLSIRCFTVEEILIKKIMGIFLGGSYPPSRSHPGVPEVVDHKFNRAVRVETLERVSSYTFLTRRSKKKATLPSFEDDLKKIKFQYHIFHVRKCSKQ